METKKQTRLADRIKPYITDMNFSLSIAIIILCIILSTLTPYFFTLYNFTNIGFAGSVIGIMAAGLTISLVMGAFDLSQYAAGTLAAVIATSLMIDGVSVWLCFVVAIVVGVCCGIVNGIILTVFKINPFITTLGTQLIFRALCYIITSSQTLYVQNPVMEFIGQGYFLGLPTSVWLMVVVYIVLAYVVRYTSFGRSVFAVGANSNASFLAGININRVRILGFVISSTCAAIAGILVTAQLGACLPQSGVGSEMNVTTAVLLGGLKLGGGKAKLSGTFLGLVMITIIDNGLTLLSVESYYQMLVRGCILVLAVLIDSIRGGGYK